MMRSLTYSLLISLAFWCLACPDEEEEPAPDAGDVVDVVPDQADADIAPDADVEEDPTGESRWERPEGYASITYAVDDSANQTYEDGEMEWNGSFIYDSATGIIEYSSAWLPDQGPFPPLYDDGPYTTGGHEAVGQTAGDHVFSAEVFFLAEETTTFEYGLINELDHWIWQGANGTVTVEAGETGTIEAPGIAFTAFGNIDFRVTLDTSNLHTEYAGLDPATDAVFVKGSMISWRPVQLLDDGARGDATAGDGIFTMTLSEYTGEHDGLLNLEQEAQFVFVFFSADGTEYKLGGDALPDGVVAYSTWDAEQAGVFLEEELLLLPESGGRSLNTAILVGPDEDIPPVGEDPILRFIEPNRGPTTGGTPVELIGERFATGATVTFDDLAATCSVQSARLITCTTPAHAEASTVPVTVENPDGKSSTHELGFTYLDVAGAPQVDSISPNQGSELGGTAVTIAGSNFQTGATVLFADELAQSVTFNSAQSLSATTPAHTPGAVTVTVRNPDGQTGSLAGGFTYQREGVDWAAIQWPTTTVTVFEGEALPDPLYGRVYEPGVTDSEGQGLGITAQLVIGPDGSDPIEDFVADGWESFIMAYNDDLENDDEYEFTDNPADPALNTIGEYDWAVRFSMDGGSTWIYGDKDGSANGYSPAQAGSITVVDSSGLRVSRLEPTAISILGAAQIDVIGTNFSSGMTVQSRKADESDFTDQDYLFDSANLLTLDFAEPDPETYRTASPYDLRLADLDDELVIEDAFLVGYLHTPTVDGTIEDTQGDWLDEFQQTSAEIPSNWGDNALHDLYASFDEAGLYLALHTNLERNGNTIVVYVDTDFGSGSGFASMSAIGDEDPCCTDEGDPIPADWWRLDRAITSNLDATALEGFGADFAFGTMELEPEGADHFINELTGWRKLVYQDNWWFDIETPCTHDALTCVEGQAGTSGDSGVIETFVPWTVLYGETGLPQGGRRMALFARIVNQDGSFISNQSLPPEPSYSEDTKWQVTQVLVLDVR